MTEKSPTRDLSDLLDGERAGIIAARKWAVTLKIHAAGIDPENAQPFDLGWNAALDALIRDLSPSFTIQTTDADWARGPDGLES